jgi:hypothetical protein
MDHEEWGGFGIQKSTFDFILKNVKLGEVFIELGAGIVSIRELSKFYNLYSVEQYQPFCNVYKNVNYIYSPIVNGWYDPEVLRKNLPKKSACVLIDGPTKYGPVGTGKESRALLKQNLDLFDKESMFIFHDTNRKEEKDLACEIAVLLNKEIQHYEEDDYYSVIFPG